MTLHMTVTPLRPKAAALLPVMCKEPNRSATSPRQLDSNTAHITHREGAKEKGGGGYRQREKERLRVLLSYEKREAERRRW